MPDQPMHHEWAPIIDLVEDDLNAAGDELPALMSVWEESRQELSDHQMENFNERLNREWAIETGIIERIYTLDEGTTRLLIEQGIDASLIAHDDNGRSPELIAGIIRDHQEAVEWLFEVVRQERGLSTSFVKELHALMTRKQEYAEGIDLFGRRTKIELRHGDYKKRPNNPTRPDGKVHKYCPPEHVAAEMDRLIALHAEHTLSEVQPDLSAAWLHHRFLQIHPFQDGNGRVARALASLALIRAGWFPIVVNRKDRPAYINALEAADAGELRPLVELIGSIQKRSFRTGLSIVGEVQRDFERLDQMLEAIGDEFRSRDHESRDEMEQAKWTAEHLRQIAEGKFEEVRTGLEVRIDSTAHNHLIFIAKGDNDDAERRNWNRYQVVDSAKRLGYFANLRDYHAWVRLDFDTESGRSAVFVSFHTVGRGNYRGVIGVSMCFYRRSEGRVVELQTVCEDLFQINYKEDLVAAERRFGPWLEEALMMGLDQWRRSE